MAAIAAVLGSALGWCVGRVGDGAFWSVVITTAAFLSVAGDQDYGKMAWPATGMTAGACSGLIAQRKLFLRMLSGAVVAGATMLACSAALHISTIDSLFNLACAPVVGALVGLLIEMISWLECQDYAPRYVTACWLLLAVIAGNLMVPWVLD
jgi:hypothetical protein